MIRKIMWAVSFISVAVAGVVLIFIPDRVPMHYDAAGNVDRYGSRVELLIFPIIILFLSLFWNLMARYYERKAAKATEEKESASAKQNARVIDIVGLCMASLFTLMSFGYLYNAYVGAQAEASAAAIDPGRFSTILIGVILIILGNFMPKTRMNSTVGVRLKWSMYNDNTWRKCNTFGGIVLIIAGLLTIIAAVLIKSSIVSTLASLGIILLSLIPIGVYSHKVYERELVAEKNAD